MEYLIDEDFGGIAIGDYAVPQDDPAQTYPHLSRGQIVAGIIQQANAHRTINLPIAEALLDVAEATVCGRGGLAAFARLNQAINQP